MWRCTRTLYQRKPKKSRLFPGFFCQFQNRIHGFADIVIVFPPMRTQAAGAVLVTVLRIPEITAAAVTERIERAVAKQAVEKLPVALVAREIFTIHVFEIRKIIFQPTHLACLL